MIYPYFYLFPTSEWSSHICNCSFKLNNAKELCLSCICVPLLPCNILWLFFLSKTAVAYNAWQCILAHLGPPGKLYCNSDYGEIFMDGVMKEHHTSNINLKIRTVMNLSFKSCILDLYWRGSCVEMYKDLIPIQITL